MLLTSVILVLQETLEAALLFSTLAVVTSQTRGRTRSWLLPGTLLGSALALVYAMNLDRVSEWFDYVGQELVNGVLQLTITCTIALLAFSLGRLRSNESVKQSRWQIAFTLLCLLTIALAITREGSEILVFLGGFLGKADTLKPVLLGGGIGFGIGVSVGFLLFYGLFALVEKRKSLLLPLSLLALFCGNMLAQAVLQLTQADWISAGPALWNTSAWLSEHSVVGRLMYALVGYESSPSAMQATAYLAGVLTVPVAFIMGRRSFS